ncbi:MAG: hypothetical protein C0494_13630 [Sphingobium sp.]|nr:hypothetical protein [Sphingobium sp.]
MSELLTHDKVAADAPYSQFPYAYVDEPERPISCINTNGEGLMTNPAFLICLGLLAGGGMDDAPADGTPPPTKVRSLPGTGGIMTPPPDPEAAIRSEFTAVEQKDSASAYDMFAQRHPGHPLAREAKRRAATLNAKAPRLLDPTPCLNGASRKCDPPS